MNIAFTLLTFAGYILAGMALVAAGAIIRDLIARRWPR